jgi:hypothetical protein
MYIKNSRLSVAGTAVVQHDLVVGVLCMGIGLLLLHA